MQQGDRRTLGSLMGVKNYMAPADIAGRTDLIEDQYEVW